MFPLLRSRTFSTVDSVSTTIKYVEAALAGDLLKFRQLAPSIGHFNSIPGGRPLILRVALKMQQANKEDIKNYVGILRALEPKYLLRDLGAYHPISKDPRHRHSFVSVIAGVNDHEIAAYLLDLLENAHNANAIELLSINGPIEREHAVAYDLPLNTAIHTGAQNSAFNLLAFGADPCRKDKEGNDAYAVAAKRGDAEIITALEQWQKQTFNNSHCHTLRKS